MLAVLAGECHDLFEYDVLKINIFKENHFLKIKPR